MSTDKRPTMLRLPERMHEQIRYLAYVEHRSLNGEIEYALKSYIKAFEEKNGEIPLPPSPSPEQGSQANLD